MEMLCSVLKAKIFIITKALENNKIYVLTNV